MFVDPPPFVIKWKNTAPTPPVPSVTVRSIPLDLHWKTLTPLVRYRSTYAPKKIIDASGVLPGGKEFKDLGEFLWHFRDQHSKFARALTNKLMEYALGRQMEISDRPEIDRILDKVEKEKLGFRDLVTEVVTSDLFLQP
jgi:hypothetical protein